MAKIDFTISPVAAPFSVTYNGHTYPYLHQQDGLTRSSDSRYTGNFVNSNTTLTFTATVTLDSLTVVPVKYKWDFGDGTFGHGSIVQHVYLNQQSFTRVVLGVLDSDGQTYRTFRILNLS